MLYLHNPAIDYSDAFGPKFQQDMMELGFRVAVWLDEENQNPLSDWGERYNFPEEVT